MRPTMLSVALTGLEGEGEVGGPGAPIIVTGAVERAESTSGVLSSAQWVPRAGGKVSASGSPRQPRPVLSSFTHGLSSSPDPVRKTGTHQSRLLRTELFPQSWNLILLAPKGRSQRSGR